MKDGSSRERRRICKWEIDSVEIRFEIIDIADLNERIADLAKELYVLNHQLRSSLSSIEIHKNSNRTKMNEQKTCDALSSHGMEIKNGNDQFEKTAA